MSSAAGDRDGTVGGLLLAAGAGRRFGVPKAGIHVGGEALVTRGVRLLAEAGCAPVVVVLGAGEQQVRDAADLGGARAIVAPDWHEGMGASLRAGLVALRDLCPAAVVALVDQPLIGVEAIARLRAAWLGGAVAVTAAYDGVRGTPVLFDAAVWPEISASAVGDRGARAWLTANPDRVAMVECADVASPDDIDTTEDLRRLSGLLAPPPASPGQ